MKSSFLSFRTELHQCSVVDRGSSPGPVKPKTIKLVFVASLLRMQQIFDWIGIRLMCTSGMKCHPDTIELNLFSPWKISHFGVKHHSLSHYFQMDALVLFDQSNCIDWIILSLTEIFSFSGTSVTCYLLRFENLVEIQFTSYWQSLSKGIFLWFYYSIQNINVDGLIWFLCKINTINTVS